MKLLLSIFCYVVAVVCLFHLFAEEIMGNGYAFFYLGTIVVIAGLCGSLFLEQYFKDK